MAEHRVIEVREHPATEPGALDGWEAVCVCGYTMAASLKGIAEGYGIEHCRYFAAKAERQAQASAYAVTKSPLMGWVIADRTERVFGAYRRKSEALSDLRLLQEGRLVASVTDEGRGFLRMAGEAR